MNKDQDIVGQVFSHNALTDIRRMLEDDFHKSLAECTLPVYLKTQAIIKLQSCLAFPEALKILGFVGTYMAYFSTHFPLKDLIWVVESRAHRYAESNESEEELTKLLTVSLIEERFLPSLVLKLMYKHLEIPKVEIGVKELTDLVNAITSNIVSRQDENENQRPVIKESAINVQIDAMRKVNGSMKSDVGTDLVVAIIQNVETDGNKEKVIPLQYISEELDAAEQLLKG